MTHTSTAPEPITPVRCTHADCPWAVHGIPDKYVGSRNDFLRRHLAEDHKPTPDPEPADPPVCPVLQCPWQPSEDGELEEHLYDAHSARQLASTLARSTASLDAQAAAAGGLLNELTEHRDRVLTEAADALEANAQQGQQSGWTRIYKRQAVNFVRSLISGAPEPEPVNEMTELLKAATEEILANERAEQDAARTTPEG